MRPTLSPVLVRDAPASTPGSKHEATDTTDSASDDELLRKSAEGDGRAFAAFVDRYQPRIWGYIRSLIGESNADDVVQTTFINIWRAVNAGQSPRAIKPWVFAIARNAAFRQVRPRAGEPTTFVSVRSSVGAGGRGPESQVAEEQQREMVSDSLSMLPPADREILILRDVEGLPGEEVAAILGLTLAAEKSRLHRARAKLLEIVRARGSVPP